jgi:hypothetical protein
MTETPPVAFTEEGVPPAGIEENIEELVELYGGSMTDSTAAFVADSTTQTRRFILPLRRGVAAGGGVECTLSWAPAEGTVTLTCDRDVDAPKLQRVLLLAAGVTGALLFMVWPFLGKGAQPGALAWMGGAVALAVYFMTLRRTSGGIAADFLQRLAARQRAGEE